MSRRTRAPELTVITWRGIPAQVSARHGATAAEKVELPARFQRAIDALAMRLGLFGTDEYLDAWDRNSRPCGPDLAAEVAAEAARLDRAFDQDTLTRMTTPEDEEPPPP